jgi:hypothetical protein
VLVTHSQAATSGADRVVRLEGVGAANKSAQPLNTALHP